MSTTPTNLPVPSEKPQDLRFNAGKIDEFVTSMALQYIDRFGHAHYTIEGLKQLTLQHIYNLGWSLAGTFQGGGTVTAAGDVLQDTSTNVWYRWDDLTTLPKTVPPGSTPESSGGTGEGKWQPVDISDVLRKDLAAGTGSLLVGYNLNQPSSKLTTVDRKLRNSIDLAADFVPGGVISGQPDLTANLQAAIVAAFTLGIPEVKVIGDFFISDMVLLYPGVTLVGGGYDKTLIRASTSFPAGGTMIRGIRPSGWVPGAHNMGIRDVYLVGRNAKDINAIDINDASYPRFTRVRMSLFNNALSINKWIDDTRVTTDGVITYPNAVDTSAGGQCYFGIVEQCYAGDSVRCVNFNGYVNRWTFISNTWTASNLAYNFSNPRGVYETNTFMTCNIESVGSAFEWFFSINSPYHNVWINTSIDNGNPAITCHAKDGGRQTFIGLALFPYGNPSLVNWVNVNPNGHRSTVLGTDNGEDIPDNQLKTQVREEFHTLVGVFNKVWGSATINTTVLGSGGTVTTSVSVPGLKSGSAVMWSMGHLYAGLIVQVSSAANSANVQLVNVGSTDIAVNTTIEITGMSKSFL
ncbi:tail fiber/spike domain-containing protein [Citrobacter braakii]|uniref:tail fiber/spike domain-containing protein n=1 Tax=Citrobacter braakii TaxID=57706 RepID=UPI003976FB6E